MKTIKTEIEWYDAKEVHPARECEVVVMTQTNSGKLCTVMNVEYEDGCFNGKMCELDVVCWTYTTDFENTFNQFKEEDDF